MALLSDPVTRRRFNVIGTQLVGAAVAAMLGVPIIGYLLSPLFHRREPVERFVADVGGLPLLEPTKYVVSFPREGWTVPEENAAVYVVRFQDHYRVLSNVCSHMQCPVRWEVALHQFLCPCHGGLYTIEGANAGGPPPKPLPEYVHRIENGRLYVTNRFTEDI
ncbi:MAG: menaquinol-cytochrome c reductase iron-sulfur subunit [Chloroflexota bacterium]|jgi:menaquinol-cytochrome c reductase iron-sulfur subunit|nr:menaquinol-cytochrome c reductase iron-sulfur subunit [Chloroflexota bacterium]